MIRPLRRLLDVATRRVPTPVGILVAGGGALLLGAVLLWAMQRENVVRVEVALEGSPAEVVARVAALTRSTPLAGNAVTVLQDGAFLETLVEEVERARTSVHLETFVWWPGRYADRLVAALAAAGRRGVAVRLLHDDFGGSLTTDNTRRLREAGVSVVPFKPLGPEGFGHLNNRDHRKIFVFDGRVGYVGGHGIGDEWIHGWGDRPPYRDTAVRVRGPAVRSLQGAFAQNWMVATGEALTDAVLWPDGPAAGDVTVHVVLRSPSEPLSHVALLHELMIAAAKHEILIQNPYFAPDPQAVELLAAAARRGVTVRLMTAGATDSDAVRHAGHALYEDLLDHGVEVLEYERTLLHQKVLVVDRIWSCVASTNFDARSLELHHEISVGILSGEVAGELVAAFERDVPHARRIERRAWRDRGLWHRSIDRFYHAFNEQL